MVNAVTNRGEKVFNAYMIVSIRFDCWLLLVGLARLGFSLSSLLLSIVTNGGSLPHHVMAALYAHKRKVSSFFLNFFFVGCGCSGVGARVWARGCGCSGVGAWVWVRGCGCSGRWVGGRDGGAGWGWAGAGWGGLDWDCRCRMARIASLGLPNPNSDCRLGCDR